jgi:hypothetical protein
LRSFILNKYIFRKVAALFAAAMLFAACDSAVDTELGIERGALSLNKAQASVKEQNHTVPSEDYPTLQAAFDDIETDTVNTNFTITLDDDVYSGHIDLTRSGFADKSITISDDDTGYTIALTDGDTLFTLSAVNNSTVTLTIEGDVTLQGISNNKAPLIDARNNSIFNLTGDAAITGNTNISGGGGGVRVSFGTFNMDGNSEIYENAIHTTGPNSYGGGVYLTNGQGVFNLSGNASIHDNTCSGVLNVGGGGVALDYGSVFNMSGGSIINNKVMNDYSSARVFGGGVYVFVHDSTFTMTGGVIAKNKVIHSSIVKNINAGGGGVCIDTGFWADGVTLDKTPRGGIIYGYDPLDQNSNSVTINGSIMTAGYGNTAQVVTTNTSGQTVSVNADKETTVASTDPLFAQYYNATNSWTLTGW